MGWENCHMHQFIIGRIYYARTDPNYGVDMKNENPVKLSSVVKKNSSLTMSTISAMAGNTKS